MKNRCRKKFGKLKIIPVTKTKELCKSKGTEEYRRKKKKMMKEIIHLLNYIMFGLFYFFVFSHFRLNQKIYFMNVVYQ